MNKQTTNFLSATWNRVAQLWAMYVIGVLLHTVLTVPIG